MIQIDLKVEVDPLKFSAAIFPKGKQEAHLLHSNCSLKLFFDKYGFFLTKIY